LTRMQGDLAAMGIAVDPNLPVHPTFLYESLWNLIGFLFLVWYTRRRHFHGELTLLYCGWYGLGRAWIEGLRTDSLMMGSFRVSQIVAILGVIISACLWLRLNHCVRAGNAPAWAMRGSDEALQAEAEAMVLPACKQASTPVATSEESSSSQDAIDPPENEDPDHPDKPNTTQQ
ncbi:MAG: prolipoprotein diacylglyceryl transferase, partial [Oscillospiraceae bacterium]